MAAGMISSTTPLGPKPTSDVSGWVGLSGLLGLFVWVLICRSWPQIGASLNLPGPRAVLSGPYAALTTMLFTGLPMVLVSLCHDKVHRRASTGIDWTQRRPSNEVLDTAITKLAGLWVTWAGIAGIYCIARWYWDGQYHFAMDVLGVMAVPMVVLSVPYVLWLDRYLVEPRDGAWHFGAMLIGHDAFSYKEIANHWRAWAVKGFFCAFMISILPGGFNAIVTLDLKGLWGNPAQISRWLTELLFLIDVHVAMVGYLLTMRPLDAHIRSANPYLAGWLAALMCYPPFLLMSGGGPLDYHYNTADYATWFAGHDVVLWIWMVLLLLLTGIYAWATVAFGIRFSNLTYRGVLTNGPYAFCRHPAYISKNTFWWLSTLPFLVTSHSWHDAIRNTAMMGLVSAIYYWRARTEEKHLLSEDAKYREYHAWMERGPTLTRLLRQLVLAVVPKHLVPTDPLVQKLSS